MNQYLQRHFYAAQIKVLQAFSPATLFHKLSQLGWYGGILKFWIDSHLSGANFRVLDVGCATGYSTKYIFDNNGVVSGVDLSENMIRSARKRNPSIDYRVADASTLPFDAATFDVVFSASVINVASNPAGVIGDIYRVCKHGGKATFLFPVEGFTDNDLQQLKTMLGLSGFSGAALTAWHKLAPKISTNHAKELLYGAGFLYCEEQRHLNGMVASVTAKKGFYL